MTRGVFVTSTGTSAGKTFVSRGLARALAEQGASIGALKPLETGCEPEPLDAQALAIACGTPSLAQEVGFYRASQPVSPYAATLLGAPAPQLEQLVERITLVGARFEKLLVEGAGGLLVPLDPTRDMSDLARALAFPLLVVAPNRLGVLSHVLAVAEAAQRRDLPIAAIVLTEPDAAPDLSSTTNAQVLRSRIAVPLLAFRRAQNQDADLAAAARESGLLQVLGWAK